MGETEIIIFIVLTNLVLLILISGIIAFVFKYRKRKIFYEKEKGDIAEQHRTDLLDTRLHIQQQTMEYIGREIHDSVAQKLTLAAIYTQRMEFESNVQGEIDKMTGISKLINDSLAELKQLSKSLTDNKLQTATLYELIQMECRQVNATGICSAHFEIINLPVIDIATKSSLIRIIQEFIQNSIKHAGCREIKIALDHSDTFLNISLKDDGKGFDPDEIKQPGSGLNNIRRRIQLMRGEYNFDNAETGGVCLNIIIPLNTNN